MHEVNLLYQRLRDFKGRHDVLRRQLYDRFKRSFSLLDVGANAGAFSVAAREQYRCYPILIEKDEHPDVGLPTIRARVSGADLLEYSKSEHFDVTLALNVLHHVEDWRPFLTALLSMGTHLVLEHPDEDDRGCKHYERAMEQRKVLLRLNGTQIAQTQSLDGGPRTMWLFTRSKHHVFTGAFYSRMRRDIPHILKAHAVLCSPHDKTIRDQAWIHGTNLWSFLHMGGALPTRQRIADMLYWRVGHGDIRPWNYILNHEGVKLFDPEPGHHPDDKKAFEETRKWILEGGEIG